MFRNWTTGGGNRGRGILDAVLKHFRRRHQDRKPNNWPPYADEDDTTDSGAKILKINNVDLLISENGPEHHTDKFDLMTTRRRAPQLVIRRGQEFSLNLHLNRQFNKETDRVSFTIYFQDGKASLAHNTLVSVPLLVKDSSLFPKGLAWSAYIDDIGEAFLKVKLKSSATCSVGRWKIAIDTKLTDQQSGVSFSVPDPIYILFNPWCSDDEVYLSSGDSHLQEYVLEDSGLIWRGTHARIRPVSWAFSQFEKDVLDACLLVLKGPGELSPTARGDPIKCARAISAAVNSNDDNGVLKGSWEGKYSGGVPPTSWTGSLNILRRYLRTQKPVKYGQCWVFAGVVTTICRALGIPCRPVTNYKSAHDTQSSLTVDIFFDDDGKKVAKMNTDSVWNFHVWNEVWIQRPDIGAGWDNAGWQVIDATPQERSEKVYRCGPASVNAVRRGDIRRPYDSNFVFSEVNADQVYWHYLGGHKPLKLLGSKPDVIGLKISTKAVGEFSREDLTDSYKYPEKSDAEREALTTALRYSKSIFSRYYLNAEFNDVRFDLQLRDDIVIGSSFSVVLSAENVNNEVEYNITARIRLDTTFYTGKTKAEVKKRVFIEKIPPKSVKELKFDVTYKDYAAKLCDQCSFNVACLASVDDTDFEFFAQDDFRVRKPDIKFEINDKDEITVGQPFTGKVKLKNPLPISLSKCRFTVDAPGLGEPITIPLKRKIRIGETAEAKFEMTPHTGGEKTISAKFTSRELEDVDGFTGISVNPTTEITTNSIL